MAKFDPKSTDDAMSAAAPARTADGDVKEEKEAAAAAAPLPGSGVKEDEAKGEAAVNPISGDPAVDKAIATRDQLRELYASGQVLARDLEVGTIESLKDFTEEGQQEIVGKFREADMASLRSKTAFFIGILKRYRNNPRFAANNLIGGGGGG
eukprot:g3407.t1